MTTSTPEGPWGAGEDSPMGEGSENTGLPHVSSGEQAVPGSQRPSDEVEPSTEPEDSGPRQGSVERQHRGSTAAPTDPARAGRESVDLPDESLGR